MGHGRGVQGSIVGELPKEASIAVVAGEDDLRRLESASSSYKDIWILDPEAGFSAQGLDAWVAALLSRGAEMPTRAPVHLARPRYRHIRLNS
jgi:hypothetical protein